MTSRLDPLTRLAAMPSPAAEPRPDARPRSRRARGQALCQVSAADITSSGRSTHSARSRVAHDELRRPGGRHAPPGHPGPSRTSPWSLSTPGFHFQETYGFADELTKRLNLNLKVYQPAHQPVLVRRASRPALGHRQPRRPEPLRRDAQGRTHAAGPRPRSTRHATYAGLRKQQTNHRANLRHVELQDGRYKVSPILRWATKDVHQYLKAHDLPYHPLHDVGYASIGDWHSTRPIGADEDERAGRFNGLKQECGLHLPVSDAEDASRASSDL